MTIAGNAPQINKPHRTRYAARYRVAGIRLGVRPIALLIGARIDAQRGGAASSNAGQRLSGAVIRSARQGLTPSLWTGLRLGLAYGQGLTPYLYTLVNFGATQGRADTGVRVFIYYTLVNRNVTHGLILPVSWLTQCVTKDTCQIRHTPSEISK